MKVEEISGAPQEWDKFIGNMDYSTFFHRHGLLSLAEKHGGGKLHALIFKKGDSVKAAFPIFMKKKTGLKLLFSPPPNMGIPFLGPVFHGYAGLRQSRRESLYLKVMDAFEEYVKELNPDYRFISTAPGLTDIRPFQWNGYDAKTNYLYSLATSMGEEKLFQGLNRKTRQKAKKAKKAGITVREGDAEDYEGIMDDVYDRYRQQGLKEQTSRKYLSDIYDLFCDSKIKILVAEKDGVRVGGTIQILHDDTTMDWVGGARTQDNKTSPNILVQWEAIKRTSESGFKKHVELGANTRHLCQFKRKFNYRYQPYFHLRKYDNPLLKIFESGYVNMIKPLKAGLSK